MGDLNRSSSVPTVKAPASNVAEERRNTLPSAEAPPRVFLTEQKSTATISHRIPHQFTTKTLITPSACYYCKKFIWGFSQQAVHCVECEHNWHVDCEQYAQDDCGLTMEMLAGVLTVGDKKTDGALAKRGSVRTKEKKPEVQLKKGHIFRVYTYLHPVWCNHCHDFIWGFKRQAWRCQKCEFDCHTRCLDDVHIECATLTGGELRIDEGEKDIDTDEVSKRRTDAKSKHFLHFNKTGNFWFKKSKTRTNLAPPQSTFRTSSDESNSIKSTGSDEGHDPRPSLLGSETDLVHAIEQEESFSKAFLTGLQVRERRASEAVSTHSGSSKEEDQDEPILVEQILSDFEVDDDHVLGSGQFGVVKSGKHKKTGTPLAVKIIDKRKFWGRKTTQKLMKREIAIMSSIKHPNIIQLFAVFDQPNELLLFMELVNGGDLLGYVEKKGHILEDEAKFLFHQLCAGVKYLHDLGVVHRDLKPENLLLCEEDGVKRLKIADFGFANLIGEESFLKSVVGTPAYVAPEILKKTKGYQKSADMWSVGVIMYACLSGVFPFEEDEPVEEQIRQGKFTFPNEYWAKVSDQAIDLICHLLVVDPKTRYDINQVLAHPWFSIKKKLRL